MPLTTTHALVPLAAALTMRKGSVSLRLLFWSSLAAAAPDIDGLTDLAFADKWSRSTYAIYGHRGATHSLFLALLAALIAAVFHKWLGAGRLAAAVSIGLAMASHGFLDMLTNSGQPVAYLWPLSAIRLFADWRPLESLSFYWPHHPAQILVRQRIELMQLLGPMFLAALIIRSVRRVSAPTLRSRLFKK